MSKFKVGDVCVLKRVAAPFAHMNGEECVVLALPEIGTGIIGGKVAARYRISCAIGVRYVEELQLELKRPKDDAEPRSDFQPCDEDFSEWMKKLGRVGA